MTRDQLESDKFISPIRMEGSLFEIWKEKGDIFPFDFFFFVTKYLLRSMIPREDLSLGTQ